MSSHKSVNSDSHINRLVERCVQHDDVQAFDELVRLHQSMLRYSLRQLTGWDESLADDLAQETFLRAYLRLASFNCRAQFSTWLYRIAYNEFINHCRKNKQSSTALELESGATKRGETVTDQTSAEQPQFNSQSDFHRDLASAMLFLSIEQRMALHLTLHRQCTQSEVADIMSCPLGTAKSHILRGREKLQEILAEWREEVSI